MAVVDFSNAVLDVNGNETPLTHANYLELQHNFWYGGYEISQPTMSILTNTSAKVSILYVGVFNASGTEFYINYSSTQAAWKVSNISFNSGDSYSFIIDIEVSGNT